jgi:sensor histidine kinase regulating citrate/malate metabolism
VIRDISIRYKIILMILAIFLLISGIIFTIFTISESNQQKRNLIQEATFLAKLTADYCSTPLVLEIREETSEVLNNLSSSKDVLYAAVFNDKNILFDKYNP